MEITMVMVMSADGFVTHGEDGPSFAWASAEDREAFLSIVRASDAVITGRNSFEGKGDMPRPYYVLTTQENLPSFKNVFYVSGDAESVVSRIAADGHEKVVLLGGPKTNLIFVKAGLVDRLLLTVEPKLFGEGKPLIIGAKLDVSMKLCSVKRLNENGTLLLEYELMN
ncbi:dihydrofolate reductase family protein [Schwartzia sp. (in: firmicutes)]